MDTNFPSVNKGSDKDQNYDKVPAEFLKGIRLTPHNFNDPENPVHGEYVTKQLRADLFTTAYYKIFYVEEDYIDDGEWYKLKSMKKVDCVKDDSFFNNF